MQFQGVTNEFPTENASRDVNQKLLTRSEAGKYLKAEYGFGPASVLAKLAMSGSGPEFYKAKGTRCLYPKKALDDWARECLGAPRRHADRRSAGEAA